MHGTSVPEDCPEQRVQQESDVPEWVELTGIQRGKNGGIKECEEGREEGETE